jgi:hypothetical protein
MDQIFTACLHLKVANALKARGESVAIHALMQNATLSRPFISRIARMDQGHPRSRDSKQE